MLARRSLAGISGRCGSGSAAAGPALRQQHRAEYRYDESQLAHATALDGRLDHCGEQQEGAQYDRDDREEGPAVQSWSYRVEGGAGSLSPRRAPGSPNSRRLTHASGS